MMMRERRGAAARVPGLARRVTATALGLFVFSLGMVLNVRANVGLSPWQALHVGITLHAPLTLGQGSQLVGGLMVLVSWLFGVRPGPATLMNAVLVGWYMDLLLASGLIPRMAPDAGGYAMLLASLAVSGFGIAGYIKGGLGAGPRDSFMLALMRLAGRGPSTIRTGIEVGAALGGFLLGAPLGLGTVVFAVGLGPSVGYWFRVLGIRPLARQAAPRPATPAPRSMERRHDTAGEGPRPDAPPAATGVVGKADGCSGVDVAGVGWTSANGRPAADDGGRSTR